MATKEALDAAETLIDHLDNQGNLMLSELILTLANHPEFAQLVEAKAEVERLEAQGVVDGKELRRLHDDLLSEMENTIALQDQERKNVAAESMERAAKIAEGMSHGLGPTDPDAIAAAIRTDD